jgi:hypothetical protein
MSSDGRRDLSLFGISDSELLAIVDDLADENGWTSTYEVRLQLGERPDDADSASRSGVGPRMSWLRRYGWLEKGEPEKDEAGKIHQTFRLTAMGHALLDHPELTKTFEKAFENLSPAQRLRLTRELSSAGHRAPMEIQTALRREWRRNLERR